MVTQYQFAIRTRSVQEAYNRKALNAHRKCQTFFFFSDSKSLGGSLHALSCQNICDGGLLVFVAAIGRITASIFNIWLRLYLPLAQIIPTISAASEAILFIFLYLKAALFHPDDYKGNPQCDQIASCFLVSTIVVNIRFQCDQDLALNIPLILSLYSHYANTGIPLTSSLH